MARGVEDSEGVGVQLCDEGFPAGLKLAATDRLDATVGGACGLAADFHAGFDFSRCGSLAAAQRPALRLGRTGVRWT